MSLYDAGIYLATAILIAGVIFVPRWISARRRLSIGIVLFVAAWVGILVALRFGWSDIMVHVLVIIVLVFGPWYCLQRLNEALGAGVHLTRERREL